jgi:pimeloyl-ACP methyl ester carboxylesterase
MSGRRLAAVALLGAALALAPLAAQAETSAEVSAASLSFRDIVSADGVPLALAESSGTGSPAIVMIHGLGQSMWSLLPALQSPLCARVKCLAFDLRGHGQSGKPWARESYLETKRWAEDVAGVIAAGGVQRPILLGWSYGTIVIADYVRHFGVEGIAGIVYVGGNGFMASPNIQPTAEQMAAMRQRSAAWAGGDPDTQLNAALDVVSFYTAKPQEPAWNQKAAMLNMQLPPYVRRILNERRLRNDDLAPAFNRTAFLYVTGEADAGPYAALPGMKQLVPTLRAVTYPGVGHSPFVETRETFLKDLAAFVDEVAKP